MLTMPLPNQPQLAVLLVHYRGWQTTFDCLTDLFKQDYPNFRVQVWDNGPNESDQLEIQSHVPTDSPMDWHHGGKNLGYGGGMNQAAAKAMEQGAEVLVVLNNDTRLQPNFLSQLTFAALPLAKNSDFGLSAPLMYGEDGHEIYYAGGKLNLDRCMGEHFTSLPTGLDPQEVDFATACCWWITSARYQEMQGFTEELFLYFEDFDFCYRLKQAGYRQYFLPSVSLVHLVGASTGGDQRPLTVYYSTRNRLLWMRKMGLAKGAFYRFFVASRAVRAVQWVFKGRVNNLVPLFLGFVDGLKGRSGPL